MKKYIQFTLIPAIGRWLAPPVFDGDPVKTRRAVLLNVIVILGLLRSLMIIVGVMLGHNIPDRSLIFALVWFFLLLLFRRMLHHGKLALVTLGLTGPLFILLTAAIMSLGTTRTPIAAAYLFWVILIGTMFQWRGVVMATVASSLAILGLILAENAGLLPQPDYSVGITQWIVFTTLFASGAGWSYYTNRITNIALVRAEQEIEQRRRAETMLRAVINNMTDPVMLKDAQGHFILVNQALARRYNTTPEAMLGKQDGDFGVPAPQAESLRQSSLAVLSTGQTQVVFEDRQDMKSGEVRHYKSIKTPVQDSLGQLQVLVVAQDMTDIVRSHRQVAESEQRFQDVMNVTREAMWDWHVPSGRVVHNRQWYDRLSLQPSEVQDTVDAFASLIHPDDKPGVMQRLDAMLRGETDSYQSDHRMVGQQGAIWVQDRGGVVERDEQGHPVRVVGSFTDVTERHAAQDRIALLLSEQQAILQSDVVGLAITKGRHIHWATPSLVQTLGYDWLEIKGRETRLLFQSEEAFLVWGEAVYPVILAHQVFRAPIQFRHKDGSLIWFDLAGTMFGENSDQVLWSCVDISAQKMAEEKLIEAKQEALAATAAKSQFLATMSHEVRTPMNGILGMAQLLVKPQLQDDKRVQYAQTILNSGHTLLSLLNDILDLSKVEAGKLKLESIAFAVDPIVGDIRSLFAQTANAKGLQLESVWHGPAGSCYLGDPHRLRQMLSNLVGNAIKFTAHGFVRIVACEIERQSQHAVLLFSVSDSGVGITNEQQARLFQPFSQADSSTTRQFGGTGLGLSIVLKLAQLMEGEVGIDSKLGQGARFWFRVRAQLQTDAQDSHQTTAALDAVPARDLTGTVLIAEDNPVNRMVIMAMLGELDCSGLTVTVVEDGQQAIDFITQGGSPDLVLMDVQMPIMNGLESTEKIRLWESEHGTPRLPIVALTANAYEEDRHKCLASGMDDFLVKPLDMEKLQAVLVRFCGGVNCAPMNPKVRHEHDDF